VTTSILSDKVMLTSTTGVKSSIPMKRNHSFQINDALGSVMYLESHRNYPRLPFPVLNIDPQLLDYVSCSWHSLFTFSLFLKKNVRYLAVLNTRVTPLENQKTTWSKYFVVLNPALNPAVSKSAGSIKHTNFAHCIADCWHPYTAGTMLLDTN
jgi:hypothetical protein